MKRYILFFLMLTASVASGTGLVFQNGNQSNLPGSLPQASPAWTNDTNKLYMGTGSGRVEVGADKTPLAQFANWSTAVATQLASKQPALSSASVLPNGVTATTQAQSDSSLKIATTGYVDTGLAGKLGATGQAADSAKLGGTLAATVVSGAAAGATAVQPGTLGNSATLNVGTTSGTVAAGDDSRIVGAAPVSSGTNVKFGNISGASKITLGAGDDVNWAGWGGYAGDPQYIKAYYGTAGSPLTPNDSVLRFSAHIAANSTAKASNTYQFRTRLRPTHTGGWASFATLLLDDAVGNGDHIGIQAHVHANATRNASGGSSGSDLWGAHFFTANDTFDANLIGLEVNTYNNYADVYQDDLPNGNGVNSTGRINTILQLVPDGAPYPIGRSITLWGGAGSYTGISMLNHRTAGIYINSTYNTATDLLWGAGTSVYGLDLSAHTFTSALKFGASQTAFTDGTINRKLSDLATVSSVPTTLAGLTGDVSLSSPTNGQMLAQNNSGKWINVPNATLINGAASFTGLTVTSGGISATGTAAITGGITATGTYSGTGIGATITGTGPNAAGINTVLTAATPSALGVSTGRGTALALSIPNSGTGVAGARIGAGATAAATTNAYMEFETLTSGSLTEKMRIDAAGNVGIGTTTADRPLVVSSDSTGTVYPNSSILLQGNSNKERIAIISANATPTSVAPQFSGNGGSGTIATPGATAINTTLFALSGSGHDGTSWIASANALIRMRSAEAFSASAQGTYIAFETTLTGTTTRSEVMRIQPDKSVTFGSTTPTGTAGDIKAVSINGTPIGNNTPSSVAATYFKDTVNPMGTCSTSANIDPTAGGIHTLTLSGACAIGVTNLFAGASFVVHLTQSSTTAPTFTSPYKWPGGVQPTWSTSSTKYDMFACDSPDGTTLYCSGSVNMQ